MNLNPQIKIMKEYRYLLDKNIEINYKPNDTSVNYKNNINITSMNPINNNNNKDSDYFFPSYNTRQFNECKNNNSKITKKNSKYSTCYNYYPRKNYSKYLNYQQATNSSSINKNNNTKQQNTTFDDYNGYNKLNTKDLIEITQKRKEIINQQKIFEQQKKKYLENNLENLDIILNDNLNNSEDKNKNYCDEGVQTSLVNNTIQTENKKEEQPSTIIFTDKSALINQEITFLSIQYSINKNNKENNSNNNSDISKEYKNTENNDFVNYDNKDKEKNESINSCDNDNKAQIEINLNKNEKTIEIKNKFEESINSEKNKNNDQNENDLEFTIVNNTQTSHQEDNDDNNYMTNGQDGFQIESNEQKQDNKNNKEYDDNNFIISNNNINIPQKIFNDSLEDSTEINNKNNIDMNKSKSLTNTEENELTEVEEFDQNLIFLQNQSKTMTSNFDNINDKNSAEKEENKVNNNNNILIEDISNNNNSEEINLDSLNDSLSIKNKKENIYLNDNDNTKENMFRFKGRKNNSFNKYKEYPNLRNLDINDNNSLKSKLYNKNNLTNNERYQIKNIEDKENEYNDLLKLKKSDLTTINTNNKLNKLNPIKNSDLESKEYIYKPNISSYNKINNNMQNIKVFSHKKLNITTNENNKINISGIPINPNPSKNIINNINERNYYNGNNIHNIKHINSNFNKNQNLKNINNKNFLITPRCTKKKRHINNYAEYYKLKISMSKDISNINSKNVNNNINNNNDYNKNYRSLGHQKSNDNLRKKK